MVQKSTMYKKNIGMFLKVQSTIQPPYLSKNTEYANFYNFFQVTNTNKCTFFWQQIKNDDTFLLISQKRMSKD